MDYNLESGLVVDYLTGRMSSSERLCRLAHKTALGEAYKEYGNEENRQAKFNEDQENAGPDETVELQLYWAVYSGVFQDVIHRVAGVFAPQWKPV